MQNTRNKTEGSVFAGFRQVLHKGTLIFALIILVLCVMIFYQHQRSAESIRSVEHTRLVVAYIDSLRTYLLNLDTAVRKYAESQNPADLDPDLICRQSSCPSAEHLIALIGADDPRAARLAPLPSLQSALETGFSALQERAAAAGDTVLLTSSERMKQLLRESDVIARLGGDEFVIVLGQVDNAAAAREVANRVVERLRQPIPLEGGHTAHIGASVGIVLCDPDGDTLDTLIKQADAALYTAKREGKNTYREVDATDV